MSRRRGVGGERVAGAGRKTAQTCGYARICSRGSFKLHWLGGIGNLPFYPRSITDRVCCLCSPCLGGWCTISDDRGYHESALPPIAAMSSVHALFVNEIYSSSAAHSGERSILILFDVFVSYSAARGSPAPTTARLSAPNGPTRCPYSACFSPFPSAIVPVAQPPAKQMRASRTYDRRGETRSGDLSLSDAAPCHNPLRSSVFLLSNNAHFPGEIVATCHLPLGAPSHYCRPSGKSNMSGRGLQCVRTTQAVHIDRQQSRWAQPRPLPTEWPTELPTDLAQHRALLEWEFTRQTSATLH